MAGTPNESDPVRVAMDSDRSRVGRLLAWITVTVMIAAPTIAILAKTLGSPIGRWPSPFSDVMAVAILGGCSSPLWGTIVAGLLGLKRRRKTELQAQEDGLRVGDRVIPYEEITGAAEVALEPRPELVIGERSGDFYAFRAPMVALRRVLSKIRENASGARLTVPLETTLRKFVRVIWSMVGFGIAGTTLSRFFGSPLDPALFLVLFSALGSLFSLHTFRHEELIVGDDGVRLPKRRGLPRFVPHRAIRDIEQQGNELRLRLKNGKSVPLPTKRMSRVRRGLLREALLERKFGESKAARVESLTRAGELSAWIERVRGFLSADGFRTPAVDEKKVADVLADGDSSVEHRVGAALALLAQDPQNAPKVRVAIDQSADERLEAALEAALEGDDGELQKVLAEA
ncbi:MAG: hypothetical protein AAGE52_07220 [Myxococcota bacterium]